jgi:hypothetical protein
MRSVLLSILLVVFTGQAGAEPAVMLSEQITLIAAGVRARLNNPDSAKFSGLVARPLNGPVLAVCGCVNTKESSGVYIGDLAVDRFLLNNEGASFQVLSIHVRCIFPRGGRAVTGDCLAEANRRLRRSATFLSFRKCIRSSASCRQQRTCWRRRVQGWRPRHHT